MKPLRRELVDALSRPVDYSAAFTAKVERLARQLSDELGAKVRHEDHMNYRAGQIVRIWADEDGPAEDEADATGALDLLVSSKGPLFALGYRAKESNHLSSLGSVPSHLLPLEELVRAVTESDGLVRIAWRELNLPAPGSVTEMDGAPATVMEALFMEV